MAHGKFRIYNEKDGILFQGIHLSWERAIKNLIILYGFDTGDVWMRFVRDENRYHIHTIPNYDKNALKQKSIKQTKYYIEKV